MIKHAIDVAAVTGGRFVPRITRDGSPTGIELQGTVMLISRTSGPDQRIDCLTGMGGVALCHEDGSVLGFGTLDMEDLVPMADAVDAVLGAGEGGPMTRMAAHGLRLVAPLDGMPDAVRGLFLLENVGPALVADAGLDDALLDEVRMQHDHDHAPGSECAACAADGDMDVVRQHVESNVAQWGHAVIGVMPAADAAGSSYTVGLADRGWPELLLTGITGDQGRGMLNAVVDRLKTSDQRPADGLMLIDVMNVPLRLRTVETAAGRKWTKVASDRHVRGGNQADTHRVVQVLWPDRAGVFPDDDRYDGVGLPPQPIA